VYVHSSTIPIGSLRQPHNSMHCLDRTPKRSTRTTSRHSIQISPSRTINIFPRPRMRCTVCSPINSCQFAFVDLSCCTCAIDHSMMSGYASLGRYAYDVSTNDWSMYMHLPTDGPQVFPPNGNNNYVAGSIGASGIIVTTPQSVSAPQAETSTPTVQVACRWDSCTLSISGGQDRLRERLRAHMQDYHPSALSIAEDKTCQWTSCVCRTHRRGRCKGLEDGHAAHTKDMITHLWQAHISSATRLMLV
jgi:hypothetical protein